MDGTPSTLPPTSAESNRDCLSPKEFARRNGISVSTVRRYKDAGRIAFDQPGGYRCRVLIPINALPHHGHEAELADGESLGAKKRPVEKQVADPDASKTKLSGPSPRWQKRKQQNEN
jgi:hypothetical protein